MVCCVSIGISDYPLSKDLCTVKCAERDAKRFFDSLHKVMGNDFNEYVSVCVSNINKARLYNLLDVLSSTMRIYEDLIVVFYFSGHATIREEEFGLLLRDYDGVDGFFEIDNFKHIFNNYKNKLLLILDCCYAGEALKNATSNLMKQLQISVFSSCDDFGTSEFSEYQSKFTNTLCNGLDALSVNDKFTLNYLIDYMKENGYEDACVNVAASKDLDFVFKDSSDIEEKFKNFPELFVSKIREIDRLSREAMWYSLDSVEEQLLCRVLQLYFFSDSKNKVAEASWLVRRAVGSIIANHINNFKIKEIALGLLKSDYWQEQCIGIIGLRYLIGCDDVVFETLENLIVEKKIVKVDAVWLANLYAKSNKKYQYDTYQNTVLSKSAWGCLEICSAQLQNLDVENVLRCWEGNEFYDLLCNEMHRTMHLEKEENELIKRVYSCCPRGRMPENTRHKFLLSAIYGNWRNQIALDLKSYLENNDKVEIKKNLIDFQNNTNIERRMALFDYFRENPQYGDIYVESLLWGLNERHPWVRRVAIEFISKYPKYDHKVKNSINEIVYDEAYPGYLDLFLAYPKRFKDDIINKIEQDNMLRPADFKSFKSSLY